VELFEKAERTNLLRQSANHTTRRFIALDTGGFLGHLYLRSIVNYCKESQKLLSVNAAHVTQLDVADMFKG